LFICEDCGFVFQQPYNYRENYGLFGSPFERLSVCPACGGTFAEAKVCELCGGYFTDTEDTGVCPKCLSGLRRRVKRVLESDFSPQEAEILRELYGWAV
jgi:RecJ-like exonuclease